jgi:hypothetical protein
MGKEKHFMRNQSWQYLSKAVAVSAVALLGFTTLAAAQRISGTERSAIFASAQRVQTSVKGVTAFTAPPKNFNALTATNRELLSYGLPQAPDKDSNPAGYLHWQKAMVALKTHAVDVKSRPYTSREMVSAGAGPKANVDGTTFYTSGNWSGIANTNTLKKWNTKTSFDEVVSYWNVPVPNHPFGNLPCSEGPWFEVTWNGIDGFNNGDVVQGGTADYWDGGGCGGAVETYGWVEWYPSYSVLPIYCGSSLCPTNPGDDFYAVTFGEPGTAEQFVFVEDITTQWGGTFGLTYISGPGVVGSSAEYIVERPCCVGSNFFPLGNYIFEFMGYNFAYDVAGTLFYPGNTSAKTAIITMTADDGSDISTPFLYGTAGNAGRYSIMLEDEGCAYSGGCTP